MKTWKKNLVAAILLIAVCGGIYINWLYTEEASVVNLTDTLDEEKLLSSDLLVMNDTDTTTTDTSTLSAYFAAVRLSRQ